MKRIMFILLAAMAVSSGASAQHVDINFDFDIYPDYYSDYEDDIYRYGFNINNYAYQYENRFVQQVSRDYGISRSTIRRYLRRGFSPSDILFGAELAYRTGYRFAYIMDGYYNSPSRNWITISLNLGIPYGSPRFNLILGSFNRYYVDWGRYYHHYHPHALPPMYHHGWSYFRPAPTPHRPPQYNQPNYRPNNRPPQVNQPNQPGRRPGNSGVTSSGSSNSSSGSVRPGQGNTGNNSSGSNSSGNSYRQGSSTSGSSSPSSSSSNREQNVRPSEQPSRSSGSSSGSNSSSGNRQQSTTPPSNNNRNNSSSSSSTPTRSSGSSSSSGSRQQSTTPPSNSSRNNNSSSATRSNSSNSSSSGSTVRRSESGNSTRSSGSGSSSSRSSNSSSSGSSRSSSSSGSSSSGRGR